MTAKGKKTRPLGSSLGGILVGFDQQIMRTLPPPHELVRKGSPVRGLTSEDGGEIEVLFPSEGHSRDEGPAPDDDHPAEESPS